jgi:hypothetical protein
MGLDPAITSLCSTRRSLMCFGCVLQTKDVELLEIENDLLEDFIAQVRTSGTRHTAPPDSSTWRLTCCVFLFSG